MTPHFQGDVHIFYGPPGTGKTHELINNLDGLLKRGYKPNEIAYTSFTREGTNQGVRRACQQFGYSRKDTPYMRTWHSLAFHALDLKKDQVIGPEHYRMFGDAIGMNFLGFYSGDFHSPDDRYLFFVDLLRNNKEAALRYLETLDYSIAQYVSIAYRTFKDTFKLLDFTDMIMQYVARGEPLPVRAAILDEVQDFTTLHWQMAEIALANCEEIYIAGDDDQAIYQWSGADVHAFMNIEGKKQVLAKSHRLPRSVLALSKTITEQISLRIPKEYDAKDAEGSVSYVGDFADVSLTLPGRYMFLARNNKFLTKIEEYLRASGILYETKDGLSISLVDIESIKLWEGYCNGGELSHSQEMRVKQAIADDAVFKARKLHWSDAFGSWDAEKRDYAQLIVKRYGYDIADQCITRVSTIHTVKGAEAENVILYLGMSRMTWLDYQANMDAEHRVFYVGVTRASENLFIVLGDERFNYELYPETVKETATC